MRLWRLSHFCERSHLCFFHKLCCQVAFDLCLAIRLGHITDAGRLRQIAANSLKYRFGQPLPQHAAANVDTDAELTNAGADDDVETRHSQVPSSQARTGQESKRVPGFG